jgi:TPR repeat protein
MSPQEVGFDSPFPTFPGQHRKTDRQEEQQILDQIGGLDISGRGMPPNRAGSDPQQRPMRPQDGDFGGLPRGYQQGYDPRGRGPGPDPGYGGPRQNDFDDYREPGYSPGPQGPPQGPPPGPPGGDFGPPARSMTMPMNDPMARRNGGGGPPMRMDSMPYNPSPRAVPPRPSTAQANRPPQQRMYPPNQGPPPQGPYDGPDYDTRSDPHRSGQSFDAAFDAYYNPTRMSNPEYPMQNLPSAVSDPSDFDGPSQRSRGSLDQGMRPGLPEQPNPGPKRVPELSRTKSQPDLRQPQAAVFEMVGDIPPMPGPPDGYYQGQGPDQYGMNGGGGGVGGLPSNPGMMRPGGGAPRGPSPPQQPQSHPTPVRPGLMPNSVVNMNNRPPPVRNYNGTPPALAPAPAPAPGPGPNPNQMPQGQAPPPAPVQQQKPQDPMPVSPELLEHLRMTIKSHPEDQDSALTLAKKLVEAADVLTPNVVDPKLRGRARDRYHQDSHKILKKLASAQNPDAMFFLADCIGRGIFSVEPDHKEAFTLYQSAAKLGHGAAAYRTAVCCEIGNEDGGGTRKDPMKAIQWYKRAATLGDTPAMYKMGMILLKGLLGQPKNPREAVGWLKRAAERSDAENPHALHELGLLYESAQPNDAILRDEQYAFSLFKQAAELGYKFSQFRLGCVFEYGLMGCPVDPRLSIMWYSKAATQEEHQSELALSGWYLTGSDGVLQQSDTEAYLWARKAAMAGLAKAEYAMGYFTEVGIGVPENMEDAKRWYWRAAGECIDALGSY